MPATIGDVIVTVIKEIFALLKIPWIGIPLMVLLALWLGLANEATLLRWLDKGVEVFQGLKR